MKILLTAKLAERSLLEHIYPITLLDEIDEIMVVRDTKGIEANKVKYYCPPSWSLKLPPLAFVFKFIIMIYLSIIKKPKLVHGYLLFPHASLAFLVGKLTNKNVGISLIAGPSEVYSGTDSMGKYPYHDPLPKLNLRGKINRWILKESDLITVTGTYTKNFLISIGIKQTKIFIPPKTISEEFTKKNVDKEYDIIFVGRLSKLKHVETLVKAIKLIKSDHPDVKVCIVGEGDRKPFLEELTNRLDLDENIYFAGYQKNVWDWFNKAKVSVVCSEREGLPRVASESLHCGVPVISSDCGDIKDLIKEGYNGYIVDKYDDYKSFSKKIITALSNEKLLENLSRNSIKSAKKLNLEKATSIWKEAINQSLE